MSSLHPNNVDKPVETIHPDNLPHANKDTLAQALSTIVEHSSKHTDVTQSIHGPMHLIPSIPWVHKLIPGIEDLANKYHVGNFVVIRGTDERIFESMPIYARIGMHLLFYGREQVKLLEGNKRIDELLRDESIKQGKIYDSPESVKSIPSFISTYNIQLDELLHPDLSFYKCFNEFFYRKLKPDARPVQNADNPDAFCSPADCRLIVFSSVALAQKFWIKGDEFSIPKLLGVAPDSARARLYAGCSMAICRLAPQDYHRFHSPLDGAVTRAPTDIPGQYYTVNPQAVNEPAFDVFTANKRSVAYVAHARARGEVAVVAVGALLVGGIGWTGGGAVRRGDELGYFAYGGSTVVVLFPKGVIEFDKDLVENSLKPVETLVKVGYSLGSAPAQ
ncbi:hypothetical protein GLOTRDRAFT_78900 [Gloeophyllum trabeum ATCC 11539]|uniref:Phosphatidylserine decarboxylase n=1 Tax=Gloeophyllum trabeum (strain ATCC 11539 / FP-39264 / Madison 617) TaxID=670483 RepID=S7Q2S0_GLOTA|nr:uncharacterized protein GLOTRDRAFT_78900 [Gloeophyllum trabeum ATCC 11539]EPQ53818.1 hypothetical protein GLOTRDRAFT_78900 [Gloeophyllum trabeum ATCC 11539]